MATKGSDNASDEIVDRKCSVCAGKDLTREAEKYCAECQDYYCIPCTDLHKAFPAMRGHKLLDKADFSTHKLLTALPCIPTERCPIHKAKVVDMFCNDHDEVVCATCVAINHRACQDIRSIPDEIDYLYNQSKSDQSKKQLNAEKNASEIIKKRKHQLLQVLKNKRETAIKSITEYRKELETEIKRLEVESIKQVDKKYNIMAKDLQHDIKETEKHIDKLEQSTAKLQKSSGNKAQEFVSVKTAQKSILTAFHSRNSLKENANVEIRFSSNVEVKDYLQHLHELGHVSTQDENSTLRTTAYKVKRQNDIDIKLKTDEYTCRIPGSCFTEDGYCLLADIDNRNLKRLDMSTETIKDHLDLGEGPIDVCLSSKQEAAVSLYNNTIQFVSLGNNMTLTKKLKMNHFCSGLAYNDGKLYISEEGSSVHIHDLNGTLLYKITTDKSGKQIFSHNEHISLSTEKDCVYVADCDEGVITLDLLGNYLSTFTDSGLIRPRGVCTDGRGNLFVCGDESSNIIQISEKSKIKLWTIKTNPRPLSLSFDPYKNKLVTTYFRSNSVTVFEFC